MVKNYYSGQLERVDPKGEYPATFQVKSEKGDTKWMNLNRESAQTLVDWLYENFPLT